ncbi:MAG: hypothetical protein A2091_02815 [Desulfuromonadales bacterium GWD2_61_12]|nr:MAG: hypothetical protein A2091_02815 [Desulfuromonadales bacterium GWD2_61_12]
MRHESIEILLDQIIEEYKYKPVDLLNINDGPGEYQYISNLKRTYLRTLNDLSSFPRSTSAQVKVLEIGAYLGVVSIALSRLGYAVTAADIPQYMKNIRLHEKFHQNGVDVITLDLGDYIIPVESSSFNVVVMCETLEHLNFNPLPVFAEINRILVKGGCLYISLPNLAALVNRVKLLSGRSIHNPISDFAAQLEQNNNMIVGIHWREYTKDELLELLAREDFSVTRHYFFTSTKSHPLAQLLYAIFPQLRPNQTAIAIKMSEISQKGLLSPNVSSKVPDCDY